MHPVLIDTDIAIDYLRGMLYAKELIEPLWDFNMVYFSVLSVYELWAGMRENEKEDTFNFIKACNIEDITPEIAVKGGELYKQYRTKGITLTSIDCLIAATAIIKKHKIATRNVEHYPDKGLLLRFKS
ncbi:MAG: type II toxin-antitoxin system VapC family toxin [Desulfobacterales bacterium]|nr:type II toxin-antitoxin system VapC family toxin [Desulfobacterales bacterium]